MVVDAEPATLTTRRLILRDSLAFAILVSATIILFAITFFLFRSFTARRAVLAQYWSTVGNQDLETHNPDAAITALRTALVYAPGTRAYQLLLAQALGESNCKGCRDESYSYYMSLWDAEPGNGLINLALARLARQRNDRQPAINFYRASIYGTWEGNGVDRRAEVRLELADYLIDTNNLGAARLELLTAGTNAPDTFDRNMHLASMLQKADDPADAFAYFKKAIADRPTDPAALDAAGNLAFASGDFEEAHRLLARALEQKDELTLDPQAPAHMQAAERIAELNPALSLPPRERADRILRARSIAKQRFDRCVAQLAPMDVNPEEIAALAPLWSAAEGTANMETLLRDPSLEASTMQLVFDTEIDTANSCNAPTGDDALLLTLARSPHDTLQPAEGTAQLVEPTD